MQLYVRPLVNHAEGNLADAEIARAEADQKENFPDGIKECGTDALRLTLLQYQQQARFPYKDFPSQTLV